MVSERLSFLENHLRIERADTLARVIIREEDPELAWTFQRENVS